MQGTHGGDQSDPASEGTLALEGIGELTGRGDHAHGAISVLSNADRSSACPSFGGPSFPGLAMSGGSVTGLAVEARRRARATPASYPASSSGATAARWRATVAASPRAAGPVRAAAGPR